MMCGADKLLYVVAVWETSHNTIIKDNAIILRVKDMYADVRTCTSIDLHYNDVA